MLNGRRVLVLAVDLFEDIELLYPVHRLREEGVEVTIAGLEDRPVTGKKGHGPVAVDTVVERVDAGGFDALVIPGGYAPDKLRRSPAVLRLVEAFNAAAKPVAFICHAGWVPISAGVVKGRRATSVTPSAATWSTPAPTGSTNPVWWTATLSRRACRPT